MVRSETTTTDHQVVILGAGFSGLGMGVCLKAQGRQDFVILEKEARLGGTWRDNNYPGSACDTESHLYYFSFAPNASASEVYIGHGEILAYAQRLVDENDLARHIRYNTEVVRADWVDAASHWCLTLADGAQVTTRVFIAAWGQLNRPQRPDFPGSDSFAGVAFHSAEWRHDVSLVGKRVASIGNAASAIQYVPQVAQQAGHLEVYQRSPNWIVPRNNRPYVAHELMAFAKPATLEANRQHLFDWREGSFERMRAGSALAREQEQLAQEHLANQVADLALRERLTPTYPLGCKRILRSDDYYPALTRSNVSLVTQAIERITPEGIARADGSFSPLDVIIYGTGFETLSFQGPVEVLGRQGASLRDDWRGGARAFLGMTVTGYPNFFMLYGPNTNLGHNTVLTMIEAQIGYVLQALNALDTLDGSGRAALDVRAGVMNDYNDTVQAEFAGSAWVGDCSSWYKNAAGRVVNNWSGTVREYRDLTRQFVVDHYDVQP